MLSRYLLLGIFGLAALDLGTSACFPFGASVHVQSGAQLVEVAPGVWVYEDDPQEVYYVGGVYWRRHGSAWQRSGYYDRGYNEVDVTVVPNQVRVIPQGRYVRYRRNQHGHRENDHDSGRDDRRERGEGPSSGRGETP